MTDYAKRLSTIAAKEEKLTLEKKRIVEKRKKAISHFAERFELLVQSDEIICGIFAELQKAVQDKSEKLKQWEMTGKEFVKHKSVEDKTTPVS